MPDQHSPSPTGGGDLFASELDAYDALCAYTLSLGDPEFIHQNVVDTWAVQHATPQTKTIALCFSMFGLYCAIEKHISGRQVQRFHMQMARTRRQWPSLPLPARKSSITTNDIMRLPPGAERDAKIRAWAEATWATCETARAAVIELAHSTCGIVP